MPKKKVKPVIDVAHPGKSVPSDNSKSVIVTNRPIIKDPMVVEVKDGSDTVDENLTTKSSTKNVIQPLSAPEVSTKDKADKDGSKPAEKPKEGKSITELAAAVAARKNAETAEPEIGIKTETEPDSQLKTDEKPAAEPSKPEEAESDEKPPAATETKPAETESKEAKAEDTSELPVDTEKDSKGGDTEEAKAAKEESQHQANEANVQKLIESKQYELPINSVEKRRSKRVVLLGILLSAVLALAWLNIALDAQLIDINGIKPLTDFF